VLRGRVELIQLGKETRYVINLRLVTIGIDLGQKFPSTRPQNFNLVCAREFDFLVLVALTLASWATAQQEC
jgi:hypothetical protein